MIQDFVNEFNVTNSSGYNLIERISKAKFNSGLIRTINYRPFDCSSIYYDPKLLGRSMYSTMSQLLHKDNIGLVVSRQCHRNFTFLFITNKIIDSNYLSSAKKLGGGYIFPLYLYPETNGQQTIDGKQERTPNLNHEIVKQIAGKVGLIFTKEKEETKDTFAPIDILDYIYAVLHSPAYREKFKEFLKIDFPRIPYPKDKSTFWQLVKIGGELRQIHLLESPIVEQGNTSYPNDGDNIVTRKIGKNDFEITDKEKGSGRVWINDKQYFDKVPVIAWEFYIGGYQPAQKWLKDRKGRELSYDDISHYQKIIVALTETDRLMKEIDKVKFI